ncbi:carotenoid oxygenase family protein [Hoyosella sp. YIM 151337]|uniref:carotenoid oxygenase family protein n=1 Tax=Hoyosella sp. YIM 151337 TaxID=2992742 RepID=UPI002235D25E|nr:carotenoid oxygenase family protein [Hoyosella sp. YIM 151337]MCW4356056.1 carotenoid oxygenase family protein [Hoyosella sp. YIM 151337]
MSTTENPAAPPKLRPVDIAHHTHLTGVFAPQREEVDVHNLAVEGELPHDLSGEYLRNGPNPRFDPIGTYVYPIDGDGMVHRIAIRDGAVSYTNRFVRTPMVVAEEAAGRAIWGGVMDPYAPPAEEVGPELAGRLRDLPDINVVRHGGRLLAMAEAAQPYRLDPKDLSTLGPDTCGGAMPVGSTAHPKIDPETGEMVLFNYLFEPPYLTWAVIAADGSVVRTPTVVDGLDKPLMIHDMALTRRYIVLFLCPLVFDFVAVFRGGSVLDWRPQDGLRVALIPRDGGPVRWCDTDAFWVWHFANAFDTPDGRVTVDYAEWSFPSGFTGQEEPARGRMARAVINPETGAFDRTVVSDRDVEFPRIDDRRLAGEHRHAAAVGDSGGRDGVFDSLLFFDMAQGRETSWNAGALSVGEPIYMPGSENDYWGMIGTDRNDMTSWFVILPVDDPASGPLCRVRMPIRVPAGLHGAWLPD